MNKKEKKPTSKLKNNTEPITSRKVIGCDIGGVVRDMVTFEPITGAIETIEILSKDFDIVFISKCKDAYKEKTMVWLRQYNLDKFKVIFCETYEDKAEIAKNENVFVMIDDKITVLSNMKSLNITKIWFCNDEQKINGTKKYNKSIFDELTLARTWEEIPTFIKKKESVYSS